MRLGEDDLLTRVEVTAIGQIVPVLYDHRRKRVVVTEAEALEGIGGVPHGAAHRVCFLFFVVEGHRGGIEIDDRARRVERCVEDVVFVEGGAKRLRCSMKNRLLSLRAFELHKDALVLQRPKNVRDGVHQDRFLFARECALIAAVGAEDAPESIVFHDGHAEEVLRGAFALIVAEPAIGRLEVLQVHRHLPL